MRPATLLLALAGSAAQAEPPRLAFPVDCTLGASCFIQNYVDRDPGPDAQDFTCASLTYDTHAGTDIALIDHAAMRAGVAVRATAAGTVAATRDGMPDILATDPAAPDLDNRACGNAVIIDHGQGWETRYCHLKQGSVAVRTGDAVTPDTIIAQVGLSGKTEFPHLHIAVVNKGETVDPFQPTATTCGASDTALWASEIPYTAGGLVSAGFSPALPEFAAVKSGDAAHDTLSASDPALVFWAQVFGARQGDILSLSITGPGGPFLDRSILLTRSQARLFRASGRKRKAQPWPAGTYTGTATLTRDGIEIGRIATAMTIPG